MNNWQGNFVGAKKCVDHIFESIISKENLFTAWQEFKRGKGSKTDVQIFDFYLEDNILDLHKSLLNKTYCHGVYTSFCVRDPKLRLINKASIRDRLLHQAIYRILYPVFDKTFIYDSYACRLDKGTHRGVFRLEKFIRKCSHNYTDSCYALQCDVYALPQNLDSMLRYN